MRISDWSSDVCSSYLHWACSSSPSYSALPSRSPTCAATVPAAGKAAGEGAPVAVARLKTALGERALRDFQRAAFLRFGRSMVPVHLRAPQRHAQILRRRGRSEEHTSELQSLMRISYAVFCLKKKKKQTHK